jgi:hypothetical protein
MREDKAVKQARKVGGSVVLSLTGFVQENFYYIVERREREIILTKIDLNGKQT